MAGSYLRLILGAPATGSSATNITEASSPPGNRGAVAGLSFTAAMKL